MPKPPSPTQMTYRGRIRSDIRTAYNHCAKLLNWSVFYTGKPTTYYPNQLMTPAQLTTLNAAATLFYTLLQSKGAIPSR